MDHGNKNRAVRAHKLNASSSRGHTIFGIYLQLDLPGGERALAARRYSSHNARLGMIQRISIR